MASRLNIVTATYNRAANLDGLLHSISVLPNSELIRIYIVDGGSKDDTAQVVEKWRDRIDICFKSEPDMGIYDAMNKGIAQVSAADDEYTIVINSDDRLIQIPEEVKSCEYDVLFFAVVSIDQQCGLKRTFAIKPYKNLSERSIIFPRIHHQGCFIRNGLLKKLSFKKELGIRADVLLMAQAMKLSRKSFFSQVAASEIFTGGASDTYNLENLISFYRIAGDLKLSRFLMTLFSFKEISKYFLKMLLGSKGILLYRTLQANIRH